MSLSTSAAPQTADKREKPEEKETTLERMSKRQGDRAKSQGGVAEEREQALERMMDEARRLLAKQNGQPVVISQRVDGERERSASDKSKDVTQGAAVRSATVATAVDSSLQSDRDREAKGVLTKIGVDATSARGEVRVAVGSVKSMIADLTAIAPPPGVSLVDWADSRERRAELVKELDKTRAKLEKTDVQFSDLDTEAAVAGRIGQDSQLERKKVA